VVNRVGFIVNDVEEQVAKWKANGVAVLPGDNGRLDQAYVETPDGVRIEILEDKTQTIPIRHEHIHFRVTEGEIPKIQAWYAKTFGGKAGKTTSNAPVVDLPGVPASVCQGRQGAASDQTSRARPYRLRRERSRSIREEDRGGGHQA
jgi:hypothetical protein